MNKMSGIDLLNEIRTLDQDSIVVIMTSQTSFEMATSALRAGAYDFLVKPFEHRSLISNVVNRATDKLKRHNPERAGRPTKPCPNCEGTGFESKTKCLRCGGKGTHTLSAGGFGGRRGRRAGRRRAGLEIDCPFCGGDGVGPPCCRKCRGSGVANPHKNPAPCPACSGTGQEFRPCSLCAGRGWVVSRRQRR